MNKKDTVPEESHNYLLDVETLEEYRKILETLTEPDCVTSSVKSDFLSVNHMLNKEERFNSRHCFSFPLCLQIELTNRCNLKCILCGVLNREESTLPRSLFQKFWKILPCLDGMTWLGGEVFLVDYFLDLLKSIHSEFPHIHHTIYTNGLLIDQKIAPVLCSVDNLQLKFSIDSVVKETYEQIRSSGKFEILLNNLSILNEEYRKNGKKPNLGINVTVMKKNLEQLILYPDFCKKYEMAHLDVSFLSDDDLPHLPKENIFRSIDQNMLDQIKNILQKTEAKCREYGIHFYCNFNSFLNRSDTPVLEKPDERRIYNQTIVVEGTETDLNYVFRCYYPWTSLFIKCNGLVVPTGDCTIPVGNILNDDLQEIWNGRIMRVYRYKLSHSDLSEWCSRHCQQKVIVNKQFLGMHNKKQGKSQEVKNQC